MLGTSIASAPVRATTDPSAEQVLEQAAVVARETEWAKVRFLRIKAKIKTSGLNGSLETLFDARSGYYRNSQQLGPASGADGFDGKTVWQQDDSGQITLQGSEDAVRGAANAAYQNARGYWHPDRFPADIVYLRRETQGVEGFNVLRITPAGGRPMQEWFGTRSHLLARTVEQAATRTTTTYLSDYRPVLGAMVAHKIRQTNGEPKYDLFLAIESVAPTAVAPLNAFSAPTSSKTDFGFLSAGKDHYGAIRTHQQSYVC